MIQDAVIDEVRAVREEIAKECGYDVHALFEAFRRAEAASATIRVSLVPRAGELVGTPQGDALDESLAPSAPRR